MVNSIRITRRGGGSHQAPNVQPPEWRWCLPWNMQKPEMLWRGAGADEHEGENDAG